MFRMKNLLLVLLITLSVKTFGLVQAGYTVDRPNGCPPLRSNFTNTTVFTPVIPNDTLAYFWDFSNGNTSTLRDPFATFLNSGTYRVKLVVRSAGGEADSFTRSVRVFRVPQANFQAQVANLCLGDTLVLNSNVTLGDAPITDYAWGFGNGIASSNTNTSYVYTDTGRYDITLVIQDSNRCSISLIKPQYVTVAFKPTAAFTLSPAISCSSSQLVTFTNTSSAPSQTPLTYSWILAPGVTSTAANPTYTYNNTVQNVQLTVTDGFGCSAQASHQVVVGGLTVDFFASNTEPCTGQPVHFTNNSNLAGNSVWDFGDGSYSYSSDPDKTYLTPGTYTVKLVQRIGSCVDSVTKVAYITVKQGFIPSFSFTPPSGGCNSVATVQFTNTTPGSGYNYLWTFGDGAISTQANPSHVFTTNNNFQVVLKVTAPNGCESSITNTVPINSYLPVPNFTADTVTCRGGAVTFQNNSSTASNINWGNLTWLWTFGDGDSSRAARPVHYYQNAGVYTVGLKISNSLGCDTTVYRYNYIRVDTIAVDFSVNQTFSPCPPFVTIFKSTVTNSNVTYKWDFGDGTTDTAANPTHIYFYPGIYTVSVNVITPFSCTAVKVYKDLIEVQGPSGTFTGAPTTGCLPLNVKFTANVSANTKNMWCDLGDGGLVNDSVAFNYTYKTIGTFNPRFILIDNVGCTVPYTLPAIVTHEAPPLVVFDTAICAGQSVNVNMDSSSYRWFPSAGLSCDTCAALTITPATSTNYVLASSNKYCTIYDTMHIEVDTIPVLKPFAAKVCRNSAIELNVGEAFGFTWSPALYLNDSTAAHPVCTAKDSMTYNVFGFNKLGCGVTSTATIKVIDKLDVAAVPDVLVCYGDTFYLGAQLLDTINAPVNFNWSPAQHLSAANIAYTHGHGLTKSTLFHVVASSDNCIADTAAVKVAVRELPKMEISENVTTTSNAEVKMYVSSAQKLNYQWSAIDSLSCADCRITNLYPLQSQVVTVTGTDEYGCKATDSLQIRVVGCDPESVFLPNIFTPNGDGLNDELFIGSKALTSLNFFRVFDQWGQLVYETKNLDDKWDGKVNGSPVGVDVFAYVLEGKCQNGSTVLKYGNVSVVK